MEVAERVVVGGILDKEELEGEGEVDKESKRVPHSLKGRDIMIELREELRKYQRVKNPESYSVVILLIIRIPAFDDNSSLRSTASILSFFGNYISLYVLSSANNHF